MKKAGIVNKMNLALGKIKLGAKRKSPEILLVAGVIGVIASGVMACAATTKLDTILDKAKEDIEHIKEFVPEEKGYTSNDYSEDDKSKDIALVKTKTAVNLVKLYAPAVILGSFSITGIIGSHYILKERNVALAAALASATESFKTYRSRVAKRLGEDEERKLYYNIVEEKVVDENGNEKTITKIGDDFVADAVTVMFDETNPNYEENTDYNLETLRIHQHYINERLRAQGYIFLNDIFEDLAIPKTKSGQVLGWIFDPNDDSRNNYIDFGIVETDKGILLRFNVDGNILTKFEECRGW